LLSQEAGAQFYSWSLHPADRAVTRVKTDDGVKQFTKLPMGAKNSPHESLSMTYAACDQVAGGTLVPTVQTPGAAGFDPLAPPVTFFDPEGSGFDQTLHMDDCFLSGDTFAETFAHLKAFLRGMGHLNMNFNWTKLELPAQADRSYGGFESRTVGGPTALEIHPKEATLLQAQIFCAGALGVDTLSRAAQASGAGIFERIAALQPDGRAWMADLYQSFAVGERGLTRASRRRFWEQGAAFSKLARSSLRWWHRFLLSGECFYRREKKPLIVEWTDSSGARCGGCDVNPDVGWVSAWTAEWPKWIRDKYSHGASNYKELRTLLVSLQRQEAAFDTDGHCAHFGTVKLCFTDNKFVADVLANGASSSSDMGPILRAIRTVCIKLRIRLIVCHVAGKRLVEQGTDGLSRDGGPSPAGEKLLTANWADALAGAAPSGVIVDFVSAVFGGGRQIALGDRPLRMGELAGKRWLAFPAPWSASYWGDAAKMAATMDLDTDIVFVIPSRAESQWARSFRRIHKIGFVRAGTSPLWRLGEHESLNFYWLPRYRVRPPSEDRYFWKHADDVSSLHRMAAVLSPSPVTSAVSRFVRELASVQAATSDNDDVGPVPCPSPSSSGVRPVADLVLPQETGASAHWIREDQRIPLVDRERLARCWRSPSAQPSVADPLEPPLVVPPGLRPVTRGDNVPHLRDPRGNAYLISQDGTFWQSEASGGRPVAFDVRGHDDLVRDVADLGGAAAGYPMPILVMADGSESS